MALPNLKPVKVVEVCRVVPQPTSPDSPTPDQYSLPLTFFDINWLRFKPIQRVFFYETSSSEDTILSKLKNSLSLTLQRFLPLAGTLTWPQDSHKPVLSYIQGDYVSVTIAESEADFHRLASSEYLQAEEYHPLVPQLAVTNEKAAVLAVQITVFPNFGFSIGTTMHHAVLDGKSSTMFFKSWAHICKHGSAVTLPDHLKPCYNDREAIKDLMGLGTIYSNDWLNSEGPNNRSLMIMEPKYSTGSVRGTFEFTQEKIEALRLHVKTMLGSDSAHHLSSFSLTCAYTWVCIVKAEEIETDQVSIIFSVDCRSRLDPPVSATYFGNCIVGHRAVADTKRLFGKEGLVVAVNAVSETIKSMDASEALFNEAETWVSRMCNTAKGNSRSFSVAGSARFEIYDTNFGWGRPKRTEVVSIDTTGAISFSDSRNGGGGVDVGVVLKEPNMKVFASLLAKGLEEL